MKTEPSQQVLIFQIGPHRGCFELSEVVQVYDSVSFRDFPDKPANVLGLVNIRGTPVPLVDVRPRWNLPSSPLQLNEQIVAFNCKGTTISIIVDKVVGTKSIPTQKVVSLKNLFEGQHPHKVIAVPDGLMLLLVAEEMFTEEFMENFKDLSSY